MPIGVEDYTAARNRAPKAAERAPAHYRTWASFDPWKDNPGCTIRVAKRPSSLVKPPFMRPAMGIGTRIEGRLVPPRPPRRPLGPMHHGPPQSAPPPSRKSAVPLPPPDADDAARSSVVASREDSAPPMRAMPPPPPSRAPPPRPLTSAAVSLTSSVATSSPLQPSRGPGAPPPPSRAPPPGEQAGGYCDSSTQTLTRDEGVQTSAAAPAAAAAARPPPPPTAAEVPLPLRNIEAFSGGRAATLAAGKEVRVPLLPAAPVRPPSAPTLDGWAATAAAEVAAAAADAGVGNGAVAGSDGAAAAVAAAGVAADVAASGVDVPPFSSSLSQLEQLDYLLQEHQQRLRERVEKV